MLLQRLQSIAAAAAPGSRPQAPSRPASLGAQDVETRAAGHSCVPMPGSFLSSSISRVMGSANLAATSSDPGRFKPPIMPCTLALHRLVGPAACLVHRRGNQIFQQLQVAPGTPHPPPVRSSGATPLCAPFIRTVTTPPPVEASTTVCRELLLHLCLHLLGLLHHLLHLAQDHPNSSGLLLLLIPSGRSITFANLSVEQLLRLLHDRMLLRLGLGCTAGRCRRGRFGSARQPGGCRD